MNHLIYTRYDNASFARDLEMSRIKIWPVDQDLLLYLFFPVLLF